MRLGDELVWGHAVGDWTSMCKCLRDQGIGTPVSGQLTLGLISDGLDSLLKTEIMYLVKGRRKTEKKHSSVPDRTQCHRDRGRQPFPQTVNNL